MNRFDLTRIKHQWAVALLALVFASTLALSGCASNSSTDAADASDSSTDTTQSADSTQSTDSTSSSSSSETKQAAEDEMEVTVSIDFPDSVDATDPVALTVIVPQDATVLDALEASGASVVTEDSSYGTFVTKINDTENGSEGASSGWTYTVNGEYATEACDAYKLSEGDKVEWSFYVG